MFKLGIIIGLYATVLFLLGLVFPFTNFLIGFTFGSFLVFTYFLFRRQRWGFSFKYIQKHVFLIAVIILLAAINVIGALGPELAFDALWYHLTIPKLYLLNERITVFQDGLLYYSGFPKISDMLFSTALVLGDEIWAKVIHFAFGILSLFVLYKLSRLYLHARDALFVVIVFYSNLVVSWLSITAYVDLMRLFFEMLAFYAFALSQKKKQSRLLMLSGLFLGFAMGVKLIAFISVIPFAVIILIQNNTLKNKTKILLQFLFPIFLVTLPYFIFNLFQAGNPFYPFFSVSFEGIGSTPFVTFINTFIRSSDPVSPVYIVILPLIIYKFRILLSKYKALLLFCIVSLCVWLLTPYAGARFLVPYLALYSLLSVVTITAFKEKWLYRVFVVFVILIAFITVVYRGLANAKYVPVIIGAISKEEFLLKNLNFKFGDFYDEKGEIKKIVGDKRVFVANIHNLYYIDFPFSYQSKEDAQFMLVGNEKDVASESGAVIYKNHTTNVTLYKLYD